jgi:hypothetical protein
MVNATGTSVFRTPVVEKQDALFTKWTQPVGSMMDMDTFED